MTLPDDYRYQLKCYGDLWKRDLGLLTAEEAKALYDLSMWFSTDVFMINPPKNSEDFSGFRIVKSKRFTHHDQKLYNILVKV